MALYHSSEFLALERLKIVKQNGIIKATFVESIIRNMEQAFSFKCVQKKSYFSTKTYVVGTQKNRRNETVLWSTRNTC